MKTPDVFNEAEQTFIYERLPAISKLYTWNRLETNQRISSEDNLFKRSHDTEIRKLILVTDFELESSPFVLEIRLCYKRQTNEMDPKNYFIRLHRFEITVFDKYRKTHKRNVCELSITSRKNDSKAYKIVRDIFVENWPKAIIRPFSDKSRSADALCIFNKMSKHLS